jgi:hypothetical protein
LEENADPEPHQRISHSMVAAAWLTDHQETPFG